MSASSILFDNDDVQIVHLDGGQRDLLTITFSNLGMFKPDGQSIADGNLFWGRKFIEKSGLSGLGFVAKYPHWFMAAGMPEAIAAVGAISPLYKKVIAYGNSMGGFGALKYSRVLGCSSVIACAPQAALSAEELAAPDPRHESYYCPDMHRNMAIAKHDVCSSAFVVYDPFCALDSMHAAKLKTDLPQMKAVPAYFAGHDCVRLFGSAEAASRLICLAANSDHAGLLAFTAALRRGAPVRALELALHLLSKNPIAAQAIYVKHAERFDPGQRSIFQNALRNISA